METFNRYGIYLTTTARKTPSSAHRFVIYVRRFEKVYDRVPRDLLYWCISKRDVPEKLVRLVEATYQGASTVVRTSHGRTDESPIKVALHQGSRLSPFLFIVVLYDIGEEFICGLPCELLFADDLAIVTDTEEEMAWLADCDGEQVIISQHRKTRK